MPIFGTNQAMNSDLPIDQIKTMRSKGMDNNTIIQSLQREGFTVSSIFDAMNQIDMPGEQPTSQSSNEANNQVPTPNASKNFEEANQTRSHSNSAAFQDGSQPSTEELVEAIIDEKWSELAENITKVVEWKNNTNDKIISLEEKFGTLKEDFDKVHKALLGKLEKYDENIGNVNSNVLAMEKTFSKMLPLFSENVAELSNVVKELKESNSKKKKE